MIRWYFCATLIWVIHGSSVDPTTDYAITKNRLITSDLTDLFYAGLSKIQAKSVAAAKDKDLRHNCTARCTVQMRLDGPFERPSACTSRISSSQCVTQIDIDYNARTINLAFKTTGNEYASDSFYIISVQAITYSFNSNQSSFGTIFACFTTDDCDWDYLKVIVNRFLPINFTPILGGVRTLVYDPSNPTVSQCYIQNVPSTCNNGKCVTMIQDSLPGQYNRSCSTTSSDTEITILRVRIFPASGDFNQNYASVVCNQNLCNGLTTEQRMNEIVVANAPLFEPPSPTSSFARPAHPWRYLTVLFVFAQWI